jgi:hypothetical protein
MVVAAPPTWTDENVQNLCPMTLNNRHSTPQLRQLQWNYLPHRRRPHHYHPWNINNVMR